MKLSEKIKEIQETGIYDFYAMDDLSWCEINDLTIQELNEDESNYQLIEVELLLSENHGQYIPQKFYQNFDLKQWNINKDDYIDLNDNNLETYWDSWEDILHNAYCIHKEKKWHLFQDGDLWAIHYIK